MLTAQDGELDTIEGLEAGANDYIAKPLRLGELIARIRLHLDQYQARADARITIGAFVFSAGSKTLTHRETAKDLSLTEKETAIIKYLLKREGPRLAKSSCLKMSGDITSASPPTRWKHIYTGCGRKFI